TIEMARAVHRAFGFDDIRVFLSTRPENRMGSDAMWDHAESALQAALEANGLAFEVNPGDGAFYGPKIDFLFRDALRREWQLTTIQLHYALPERLHPTSVSAKGQDEPPAMIHRAPLRSLEPFLALLIEH